MSDIHGFARAVQFARVSAALVEECKERRKYWIGGVPTKLDLQAAANAVAKRLTLPPETVTEILNQIGMTDSVSSPRSKP